MLKTRTHSLHSLLLIYMFLESLHLFLLINNNKNNNIIIIRRRKSTSSTWRTCELFIDCAWDDHKICQEAAEICCCSLWGHGEVKYSYIRVGKKEANIYTLLILLRCPSMIMKALCNVLHRMTIHRSFFLNLWDTNPFAHFPSVAV